MTLQELMMLYGVTLGARCTQRQRYLFGSQLRETLTENGWEYHVQRRERGGTLLPVENVIVGDLERAKTVFAVPYDTPARAYVPCRYYPLCPERTLGEERRDMAARLALGFVPLLLSVPLLALAMARRGSWLAALIPAAALLFLAWRVWKGRANPVNFNRFSASVAVCVRLLERLRDRRDKVAFVFCDRGASSYEGYKLLSRILPQGANLVLLDSIAKGETLMLAHGPLANLRARSLLERLPSGTQERAFQEEELERNLLSFFPGGMVLTGGTLDRGELVVEDTRTDRDHRLDLPRLEEIAQALEAYARG